MNEAVLYELQNMSEATGSSCGTCAKLEVLSAQIVKAAPRVRPYPTSNNGACFKTKLRKVIYKKSAPLPFAAIRGITDLVAIPSTNATNVVGIVEAKPSESYARPAIGSRRIDSLRSNKISKKFGCHQNSTKMNSSER